MQGVNFSSQFDNAYLINGGAPAGISIVPDEDGCLTMRTSIKIITRSGNKSTAPNGMDIDEFPFKRMRLLKNPNLGSKRSCCRDISSSEGRLGGEGIRFAKLCTNPMNAVTKPHRLQDGGCVALYQVSALSIEHADRPEGEGPIRLWRCRFAG